MSSEPIIDAEELVERTGLPETVEAILEPISEQAPAGRDLREDETLVHEYYRLRDVRTANRNREREAITEGNTDHLRPRDWQPLADGIPPVLRGQSKDAELAAWLIEALTRLHGFAGAALGFHVAARLIETYSEALYPPPDAEGVATQLAALAGLNGLGTEGALITPLKSLPLTQGNDPGPFCTWECEQAFELARLSDTSKRETRSQRGYVTPEAVDEAVAQTDTDFLRGKRTDIQAAIAEFNRYRAALDAYVPDNPQPTSRLESTLDGCLRTMNYLAGERLADESPPASTTSADGTPDETADGDSSTHAATWAGGHITDREAALQQLREIARFFRRTEPHSPISYSIEQVVRWSDLSLPELIQELIPDEGARSNYRTLTGIPSRED
ncbi:type VI secretion system protein TssA [Aquisalimonas lutea]|uniref:type VI secretion system protein TssA n=1 Tax=Aquisalimonas lutea TaxID=1327750 RepID=UPI0025B5AF63|nr:type VI secretion system protein TssA [Aquisalimonas lutea]MDN3519582.1 type VI secretion system protein TssA [Aquisalimonas lutea]